MFPKVRASLSVVSFFVFCVGSVECWRYFEGVLSSDAILKDLYDEPTKFQPGLLRQKFRPGPTDI